MKQLTDLALDTAAAAGSTYADMRIVDERQNRVTVLRRSLKELEETEKFGYCVRVLLNGAWGFAYSTLFHRDEVARTAKRAVSAARASARVPKRVPAAMAPEERYVDTRTGPCLEDPFQVPPAEKAELLLTACDRMLNVPNIVMAWGALQFVRVRRIVATSDGSYLDMTHTFSFPQLGATAVVGTESQNRQYQGGARQAGFEFVRTADLVGNAKRWAEEAVLKCKAEDSPQGVMDLVLDPDNLALTMHESVGHPIELDRILGWEANMAGKSFVRPEDVGKLRYGSPVVNFTTDNTLEGGLGSWFYDDDGVKMTQYPTIKDGVLVGLSTTRETVPLIGWPRSSGCCRSDGFEHFPITRNPNLYMEPGPDESVTPDDLIRGVDRGVYIEGMGSFSIDQMRRNFQFGGDLLYLIEHGRKTTPLKKVTYQSETTKFWGSCDAVAGRPFWRPHGVMNCGKGEPMQIQRMTHGASVCRFRNVLVGGARL